MSRPLIVLFALAALALTPNPAIAKLAEPSGQVSGRGTYLTESSEVRFTLDAHPAGVAADAVGHIRFEVPSVGFWTDADVTQLVVEGNVAYVCGVVTDASQPETDGWKWIFSLQDNGRSGTPDLLSPGFIGPFWGDSICDLRPPPDTPITSGDIVISGCKFKGATTTKNKCKNKGARSGGNSRASSAKVPPGAQTSR